MGFYDKDINYSKYRRVADPNRSGLNALGRAFKAFGDTYNEWGENDDNEALANLQTNKTTTLDGVDMFNGENTLKANQIVELNKQKADQELLGKVMAGSIPQSDFTATPDTQVPYANENEVGYTIEQKPKYQVFNADTQASINNYYDKEKSKQNIANIQSMMAQGLPSKDIVNSFKDENGKSTLDADSFKILFDYKTNEDKIAWEKNKLIEEKKYKEELERQKHGYKMSQLRQDGSIKSQVIDKEYEYKENIEKIKKDSKNDLEKQKHKYKLKEIDQEYGYKENIEKIKKDSKNDNSFDSKITTATINSIIKQNNKDKTLKLINTQEKYKNGKISKDEHDNTITQLSKEPLSDKQLERLKAYNTQLTRLKALKKHLPKGKTITGNNEFVGSFDTAINNITPTWFNADRAKWNSLEKELLLLKTDQMAGTLTERDMQILNSSGLTTELSYKDYTEKLNSMISDIEQEQKDIITDYDKKYDLPDYFKPKKENTIQKKINRKSIIKPTAIKNSNIQLNNSVENNSSVITIKNQQTGEQKQYDTKTKQFIN